jgi:hypothetical protein
MAEHQWAPALFHQFLSPGGRLFEQIASEALVGKTAREGKIWMIEESATATRRFVGLR